MPKKLAAITVGELISILKEMPRESPVVTDDGVLVCGATYFPRNNQVELW